MNKKGTLKICNLGHKFYKKRDCLTCPICEEIHKPKDNYLATLVAPARRALERENFLSLKDLCRYSEKEILLLHRMGKSSILKLKTLLTKEGFHFKI